MLRDIVYYCVLFIVAILSTVVWFGIRYMLGVRLGVIEAMSDDSKPGYKRWGPFACAVAIVFGIMVYASVTKGPFF